MKPPTDGELARWAREGDEAAFRTLAERHRRFLVNLAYRFLASREEAEDAAQDVLVKWWRNLQLYRDEVKITTWLYTLVTNHCLDVLRSAERKRLRDRVPMHDELNVSDPASLSENADLQERLRLVAELAARLPEKQHAVFVLRDLQGVGPEEAAEILGTTTDVLKSNLYHARLTIRAMILEYEKEKRKP